MLSSLSVLLAYLLGSIPFGLLLGFLVAREDIRKVGSGNIGATNVGRALGRSWALVAFLCDFGKGWVSSFYLAPLLVGEADVAVFRVLCGAAAVLGHCWPVYLRYRGGKGVAAGCGALVGLDPLLFLYGGLVWLVVLALTRFVGLSSILMGLSFPVIAWFRLPSLDEETGSAHGMEVVFGALAFSVLVIVRHRANIRRMLEGIEPKVGRPGGEGPAPSGPST